MEIINARVKQKVGTEAQWLSDDTVLLEGEQAFVINGEGQSVNFKIGDGTKRFSELEYFFDYSVLAGKVYPITPTDPAPTLDGVYIPEIDGTYANLGGIIVDRSEGGEDYGKSVTILKNGSQFVKVGEPLPMPDLSGLATKEETLLKDDFIAPSRNLANPLIVQAGPYFDNPYPDNSNNWISLPIIDLKPGETKLNATGMGAGANTNRFNFFNDSGTKISQNSTGVIPAGATKVGINVAAETGIGLDPVNNPYKDTMMVYYGSVALPYEPFDSGVIKLTRIEGGGVVPNNSITVEKTNFIIKSAGGKNLYDVSKGAVDGQYIDSGFVKVPENTQIAISTKSTTYNYITDIKCFNINKVQLVTPTLSFINTGSRSARTLTTPAGCEYITFRYRTVDGSANILVSEVMVEIGPQYSGIYEEYIISNELADSVYIRKRDVISEASAIYYVSPTGSDSNTGTSPSVPLATFNKAIALGAKKILAFRGDYLFQSINANNLDELTIVPFDNNEVYSHANPNRKRITLSNGEDLTSLTNSSGILVQAYGGATLFNEVFVAKTQTLYNGSVPRVVVWQQHSDFTLDRRLVPVLTLAEVQATQGTFTWNGTNIYINPYSTAHTKFTVHKTASGSIELLSIKKIVMEDVEVRFGMYDGFNIKNTPDLTLRNCKAIYVNYYQGFALDNLNGNLYKCIANKVNIDGFNMHGYGETNFFDCVGSWNYDDGMSHHDGCIGSIFGGEYSNNGKAGNAPAYGATVNIYNGKYANNAVGIGYLSTPNGHAPMKGIISGNLLLNNTNGLKVDPLCTVDSFGNIYSGNTTDKVVTGVLNEY